MKHIFLILLSAVSFLQCNRSPQKKVQAPEQSQIQGKSFYYYPRANVYYDIEEKQYIFFDSLKNTWEKKQQPSPEEIEKMGKKIAIENPSVPVFKDNQQHRIVYGTALYTSTGELRKKFI